MCECVDASFFCKKSVDGDGVKMCKFVDASFLGKMRSKGRF